MLTIESLTTSGQTDKRSPNKLHNAENRKHNGHTNSAHYHMTPTILALLIGNSVMQCINISNHTPNKEHESDGEHEIYDWHHYIIANCLIYRVA